MSSAKRQPQTAFTLAFSKDVNLNEIYIRPRHGTLALGFRWFGKMPQIESGCHQEIQLFDRENGRAIGIHCRLKHQF